MPVTNVNMSYSPAGVTPQFDLASEQGKIGRMRAIAQALFAASQKSAGPLIDAGAFKIANWGDAVRQVANAYSGRGMMDQADTEEGNLNSRVQQRIASVVDAYGKHLNGTPATPEGMMGGSDTQEPSDWNQASMGTYQPGSPGVKANPQAAAMDLIQSNIPGLEKAGLSMKEQLDKGIITPKDLLPLLERKAATVSSVQSALGNQPNGPVDFSKIQPVHTVEQVDHNLVDTTPVTQGLGGPPVQQGYYGQHFTPIAPAQPNLPPTQASVESGKTSGIQGGAQMPETMFDQEFSKTVSPDVAKDMISRRDVLTKGVEGMPAALALMDLPEQAYTGAPWSGQQLWAQKAAQALGLAKNDPRVSQTEVLRSLLNQKVVSTVKQFTSRLSNNELGFLTKAQGTDLSNDPQTTKALTAMYVAHLLNEQDMQGSMVGQLAETQPVSYKTAQMLMLPRDKQINADQLPSSLGLARDPASGQWSTTLIPGPMNGGVANTPGKTPIPSSPGVAPIVQKLGRQPTREEVLAEIARRKAAGQQ